MIKIFNKELLKNIRKSSLIKRGVPLFMAATIAITLTACKKDTEYENTDSQIEATIEINRTALEKMLNEKDAEFSHIYRSKIEKPNRNFEVAVYEKQNEFGKTYCKIVDGNGMLLNGITYYGGVIYTDESISILQNETYDYEKNNTFTLLDHNTGITKEIEANYLYTLNGYIVKSLENEDNERTYQLLYNDGTAASDELYNGYTGDNNTGRMYLQRDNRTIILDTNTGDVRLIDGRVTSANENFIVLDKENEYGVYYLESMDADLIEKIPCSFDMIYFTTIDETEPTFCCEDYDLELDESAALYSVDGERLSNYYRNISAYFDNTSGYIEATSTANIEKQRAVTNLINKYGVEEVKNINAYSLRVFDDTDFILFRENGKGGKYGLLNLSGVLITNPIYDSFNINYVLDSKGDVEDFFFIARIEDENTTIVLDKELNELLRGEFGYCEARMLGTEILKNSPQKKLILNQN